MTLKAVIFDLDDTLLDWSGFSGDWQAIANERLKSVYAYLSGDGHSMPPFDDFVADINLRSLLAWQSFQSGKLDAPTLREVVRESLANFGLDMAAIDVEDVLRHYPWGQVPGTRLFPEVKPVLKTLRGAGLRLGLLTNAFQPMWMRDKELRDLDIEHYLDCRLSAADVGKLKPHPLPFERALQCLGVSAGHAVYVGDSLASDIAGAQAAGLRAVWRDTGRRDESDGATVPDATINNLDDLLPVLDGWFPGWREG